MKTFNHKTFFSFTKQVKDCVFINCKFIKGLNAVFESCLFQNCDFKNAEFTNCIFDNTRIINTNLNHASFQSCKIGGFFISCDMKRFWVTRSDLSSLAFTNCKADSSFFGDCVMKNNKIYDSDFASAEFVFCEIVYPIIAQTNFSSAGFFSCHLKDMRWNNGNLKTANFENCEGIEVADNNETSQRFLFMNHHCHFYTEDKIFFGSSGYFLEAVNKVK